MARDNLKTHGAARRPAPMGLNFPALVRVTLADSLAYALILINAPSGVFLRCWVSKRDSPF